MKILSFAIAIMLMALLPIPRASADITYAENFETRAPLSATALSGAGWKIGNIIIAGGSGAWFGPGNEAPNCGATGSSLNGYSALVETEGGPSQGNVQLSVFSDYNSWSPFSLTGAQTVDTFVYLDLGTITADMSGKTYGFGFDTKEGNISGVPASEAYAYINVLKSSNSSYATLFNSELTTKNGTTWNSNLITITVDSSMVGELLQIGFRNRTTEWAPSGVYYDNLNFSAVPEPSSTCLLGLGALITLVRRRRV